jgi:hypothetical protein
MSVAPVDTWEVVNAFPSASTPANLALDYLVSVARQAGIQPILLTHGASYRALIIPLCKLHAAVSQGDVHVVVERVDGVDIDASDNALFVVPIQEAEVIKDLFTILQRGTIAAGPPRWVGLPTPVVQPQVMSQYLVTRGAATPSGKIILQPEHGDEIVFDLYQLAPSPAALRQALVRGADLQLDEGPDNLQRRADWFKRRAGSSQDE